MHISASFAKVVRVLNERKSVDLVSLFTMPKQIGSYPFTVRGEPETKTVARCSYFHIGKCGNNPVGLWCGVLTYLHTILNDRPLRCRRFGGLLHEWPIVSLLLVSLVHSFYYRLCLLGGLRQFFF